MKKMRVSCVTALMAAGAAAMVSLSAVGAEPAVEPKIGMTCTVADGWWSLDPKKPEQPEPVKVLALQALFTGEPGVWVQPLRGKLTDQQYHVAQARLSGCRKPD